MKKLFIIIIIAGILVILYPVSKTLYYDYLQKKILKDIEYTIEKSAENLEDSKNADIRDAFDGFLYLDEQIYEIENGATNIDSNEIKEQGEQDGTSKGKDIPEQLGILYIEKIDLKLPILKGSSKDILDMGAAGYMEESTPIGEVGNTAIAAHRSHTYGRNFNRLDELKINDKINIETTEESFEYTVFSKKIVEPDDFSVLEENGADRILTLITCHPMIKPTHRLIVQAKINKK
ncbi:MAG TPA: class D sortase [Clostridiaceae bacterium]|nr:class D sortase [Clostridiaceae bacterium]